jgi:hypothetical protein
MSRAKAFLENIQIGDSKTDGGCDSCGKGATSPLSGQSMPVYILDFKHSKTKVRLCKDCLKKLGGDIESKVKGE